MRRALAAALVVLSVVAVAIMAWLVRTELGEQITQTTIVPTPELIEQGRYLARAGNCIACHTEPGGSPFAGGRLALSDAQLSIHRTGGPSERRTITNAADLRRLLEVDLEITLPDHPELGERLNRVVAAVG